MKRQSVCLALLAVLVLGTPQSAQSSPPSKDPGLYATLETSMGKIVVRLFEREAPKTVANFVDLATGKKAWRDGKTGKIVSGQPFYDGIIFHRVIANFMVQAGAHLPDGFRLAATIPDEVDSPLKYDRPGRLGMANSGPNTGSSQFFITHVPTPGLNGKHTIFGQVVEGQALVNNMAKVKLLRNELGEMARPATPIKILKVVIERVGAEGKDE